MMDVRIVRATVPKQDEFETGDEAFAPSASSEIPVGLNKTGNEQNAGLQRGSYGGVRSG